jgi:hypothetical protein
MVEKMESGDDGESWSTSFVVKHSTFREGARSTLLLPASRPKSESIRIGAFRQLENKTVDEDAYVPWIQIL